MSGAPLVPQPPRHRAKGDQGEHESGSTCFGGAAETGSGSHSDSGQDQGVIVVTGTSFGVCVVTSEVPSKLVGEAQGATESCVPGGRLPDEAAHATAKWSVSNFGE